MPIYVYEILRTPRHRLNGSPIFGGSPTEAKERVKNQEISWSKNTFPDKKGAENRLTQAMETFAGTYQIKTRVVELDCSAEEYDEFRSKYPLWSNDSNVYEMYKKFAEGHPIKESLIVEEDHPPQSCCSIQ